MEAVTLELVGKYTKTSIARLESMAECLSDVDRNNIAGDIVECGVWKGGNIILARKKSPNRVCWLYDTFKGMTDPGPEDTKRSGMLAQYVLAAKQDKRMSVASLKSVIQNLKDTGCYDDRYLRFIEGKVEQTLLKEINLPEKIAVLRLDTDWYASTKIELEVLYPRLVSGGYLLVDDYGHWMGANKAVREYFGPELTYEMIDYTAIKIRKS